MAKYMTRQRRILLDYLASHPDEQLAAQQISDALEGESVSLSAVYRNLSELELEGKVRRSLSANREGAFQFLDAEDCKDSLHLCCSQCGRTSHMDAEDAAKLLRAVQTKEGFALDKHETVLYGLCAACQRRNGGKTHVSDPL